MKHRFACCLSALCCLLLTGCLEFEDQVLSYHYDQRSDTLRIFQDYHGIFGSSAKDAAAKRLSDEEVDQLASVLKGQRTFFFSNWILEFNREEFARSLAKLRAPEKTNDEKLSPAGIAKLDRLLQLLLDNVRVENGAFYFNKQGKLCGVQHVIAGNFSKIIAAANEFAPFFIQMEAQGKTATDASAMNRFASHPRPLIQLRGNSITLQWPMTRDSYEATFGNRTKAAEFRRGGLTTAFGDDVVTLKLGKPSESISRLALRFSTNTYAGNLVEAARAQHLVQEKFDPAADAKSFLLGAGK